MTQASNSLRSEAEELIRAEIARAGPEAIDKGAIVRRFVDRGACKTRVHEWIKALVRDAQSPAPDTLEADVERHASPPPITPEPAAAAGEIGAVRTSPVALKTDYALAQLQDLDDTAHRVLTASHHADGRVRNPRLALAATESLRRLVETSLKLRKAINDVRTVEQFIAEVLAAIRAVDPDMAARLAARWQSHQQSPWPV